MSLLYKFTRRPAADAEYREKGRTTWIGIALLENHLCGSLDSLNNINTVSETIYRALNAAIYAFSGHVEYGYTASCNVVGNYDRAVFDSDIGIDSDCVNAGILDSDDVPEILPGLSRLILIQSLSRHFQSYIHVLFIFKYRGDRRFSIEKNELRERGAISKTIIFNLI